MRDLATIAALDQIEAPAIELASGIYDIAPEREEVELEVIGNIHREREVRNG